MSESAMGIIGRVADLARGTLTREVTTRLSSMGDGRGTLTREITVMDPDTLASQNELLQERIAELEFMQEDDGWQELSGESSTELSKETLRKIIRLSQVMYLKNPLIDHGCAVISHYVFGQGVKVAGTEATNDRVRAFMTTRVNKRVMFGKQAALKADAQLSYEGNVFLALFGIRGEPTEVRIIPTLQIVAGDIICNPEDDAEPWYYRRIWQRRTFVKASGETRVTRSVDYYPALGYRPANRPKAIGRGDHAGEVHWDTPVLHVSDGGLNGGRFGVPTTFSSLDWAKAVTRDLSNYATIKHALARFAWSVTAKNRAAATTAKSRLATTVKLAAPQETNPPPVTGAAWIGTEGNTLSPIKTAGMQPSPEEGRRVGLMVSAGMGVPETILFGNADVGNLATAKTLDRPTELMMLARQGVWEEAYAELLAYDLSRAIAERRVPSREPDPADPSKQRATEVTATIDFPDILERSVTERVEAVIAAATLGGGTAAGTMPDDLLVRLLLVALDVDDIDEILEELFPPGTEAEPDDDNGATVPTEASFTEALDAFRRELVRRSGAPGPRRRSVPAAAATEA